MIAVKTAEPTARDFQAATFPDAAKDLYAAVIDQLRWHVDQIRAELDALEHHGREPQLHEVERDARAILAYATLLQRPAA